MEKFDVRAEMKFSLWKQLLTFEVNNLDSSDVKVNPGSKDLMAIIDMFR